LPFAAGKFLLRRLALKRVNHLEVVIALVYSADALGPAAGLAFVARFFVIAFSIVSASVLAPGFTAASSFLGVAGRGIVLTVALLIYLSSDLISVFFSAFTVAFGVSAVAAA
jgi:hypothetical protein